MILACGRGSRFAEPESPLFWIPDLLSTTLYAFFLHLLSCTIKQMTLKVKRPESQFGYSRTRRGTPVLQLES
ncbi:hypothetical protein PILCRDRAFT_828932 [Piloderma croceum F 1598]|uniref:Uncharacterized protein n=1 Tax=Piloderma croceum (strain F 1598) TaxID=765440 RepID=A0A0C3EM41_PILCF|nr:hypothetical protein PILCRDRAFT_828932 [Piloderma croceum F 1598]